MASLIRRCLVVLLAGLAVPPALATDPSPTTPAKSADTRRAALVHAGYTHVPLSLKPGLLPPGVPVPAAQSFVYVDGAVGPEKVKFLLDSGSWYTELDLAVAKRLKLELGEEATSVGVAGGLVKWATRVPGLIIGPYDTHKDWNVMAAEAADLSGWLGAAGGMLGMEVLDQWTAVVDFPARALYLRPPLLTAWPRLAGTWSVTSWQEEGEARKIDSQAPPTLTFADHRLRLTDDGQTREYAIRLCSGNVSDNAAYGILLFDPKQEGKPDPVILTTGLVKVAGGRMTACLALDAKKAKEQPAEFAAPKKGSGLVLLELKHTAPDAQKPPAEPSPAPGLTLGGYGRPTALSFRISALLSRAFRLGMVKRLAKLLDGL